MNKNKKSYMNTDNILYEGWFSVLKKLIGVKKSISGMNKNVKELEKLMNKTRKKHNLKPVKLDRFEFEDFVDAKK